MKTRYLIFLLFLIFSGILQGQIIIKGTDLPNSGKGFIMQTDSTSAIAAGSASANSQIWNFPVLQNQGTKYAAYSANNPYNAYYSSFTNANIYIFGYAGLYGCLTGGLPLSSTDKGYTYLKSDSTGLKIIGFRNDQLYNNNPVVENPSEMLMKTPFTMDSVYSGRSRWTYSVNVLPPNPVDTMYVLSIKKTLTADAWGTLNLPGGTYQVLRVHEYITKADSAYGVAFGTIYSKLLLSADTLHNYYFWAKNIGFPVAKISCNKFNQTKSIEYLTGTFSVYCLQGRVFSTDGHTPVSSGTVSMIFKDSHDHLFDFYETVLLNPGGYYRFSNMPSTSFLVYADPDTATYPYNIPTYYGNKVHWQNATVMNLISDTTVNINSQNDSISLLTPGQGQVSGSVLPSSAQKSLSQNADKIKVVLEEDPGGSVQRHIDVGPDGHYNLTGIDTGKYRVSVEIPGLNMVSYYSIKISNDSLIHTNLIYYYDTLVIFKNPHAAIEQIYSDKNRQVKLYPNPFIENIKFSFTGDKFTTYKIEFFDICGHFVFSTTGAYCKEFTISDFKLMRGIYLYKILFDEKLGKTGKIVKYDE